MGSTRICTVLFLVNQQLSRVLIYAHFLAVLCSFSELMPFSDCINIVNGFDV